MSDPWQSLADEWYDMRKLIKDIDNELNKDGITDSTQVVNTIVKLMTEFKHRGGELNK